MYDAIDVSMKINTMSHVDRLGTQMSSLEQMLGFMCLCCVASRAANRRASRTLRVVNGAVCWIARALCEINGAMREDNSLREPFTSDMPLFSQRDAPFTACKASFTERMSGLLRPHEVSKRPFCPFQSEHNTRRPLLDRC